MGENVSEILGKDNDSDDNAKFNANCDDSGDLVRTMLKLKLIVIVKSN